MSWTYYPSPFFLKPCPFSLDKIFCPTYHTIFLRISVSITLEKGVQTGNLLHHLFLLEGCGLHFLLPRLSSCLVFLLSQFIFSIFSQNSGCSINSQHTLFWASGTTTIVYCLTSLLEITKKKEYRNWKERSKR